MKIAIRPMTLAWLLPLVAGALLAHHSIAADFQLDSQMEFRGTIGMVEWTNPHARFWVDVPEAEGEQPIRWEFELGSPNSLIENGWTRDTLRPGDAITVTAHPGKKGALRGSVISVVLADGRRIENYDRGFSGGSGGPR